MIVNRRGSHAAADTASQLHATSADASVIIQREGQRQRVCLCLFIHSEQNSEQHVTTGRALGTVHVPPTKVFRRLAVNKAILKPRLAAATGGQYVYVGFSRRNKIPRCSAYTISEKAIRFRHPDYNPDRAQKLISSSMSRHLSTRNISSKSVKALLRNLVNRQTDNRRQTHLPPPLSEVKYIKEGCQKGHPIAY